MTWSDLRKKKQVIFLLFPLILFSSNSYTKNLDHLNALQNPFEDPNYWISRIKNPDKVLLSPQEITSLNQLIQRRINLMKDPLSLPKVMERNLVLSHLSIEPLPPKEKRYDKDGLEIQPEILEAIKVNIYSISIPKEVEIRFGLIKGRVLLRAFPTKEPLYSSPEDAEKMIFDRNLYSTLELGTQVAMIHTSRDGLWAFVLSTYNPGWMPKKEIIFINRKDLEDYLRSPHFLVITEPEATLFNDTSLTQNEEKVRMGTRLPLVGEGEKIYMVRVPYKSEGGHLICKNLYLSKEAASKGYLPFTKKNLIRQAFKCLGMPYGWAGDNGIDCSQLVREVFATMGILLPRNSHQQWELGGKPPSNLEELPSANTLLFSPHHVMIYLGKVRGKHYVLHSLWSYKKRDIFWNKEKMVGRVLVSTVEEMGLLDKLTGTLTIPPHHDPSSSNPP